MPGPLYKAAAIVGAAEANDIGFLKEPKSSQQLHIEAIKNVSEQTGIPISKIDGVFSAEPDGVREGCEASDLDPFAPLGAGVPELPCDGRTTGVADLRTHTVTWTCVGCPLGADRLNRAIGMSEDVKVGEGVVPSWALYADFGD